eukprot:601751_1
MGALYHNMSELSKTMANTESVEQLPFHEFGSRIFNIFDALPSLNHSFKRRAALGVGFSVVVPTLTNFCNVSDMYTAKQQLVLYPAVSATRKVRDATVTLGLCSAHKLIAPEIKISEDDYDEPIPEIEHEFQGFHAGIQVRNKRGFATGVIRQGEFEATVGSAPYKAGSGEVEVAGKVIADRKKTTYYVGTRYSFPYSTIGMKKPSRVVNNPSFTVALGSDMKCRTALEIPLYEPDDCSWKHGAWEAQLVGKVDLLGRTSHSIAINVVYQGLSLGFGSSGLNLFGMDME